MLDWVTTLKYENIHYIIWSERSFKSKQIKLMLPLQRWRRPLICRPLKKVAISATFAALISAESREDLKAVTYVWSFDLWISTVFCLIARNCSGEQKTWDIGVRRRGSYYNLFRADGFIPTEWATGEFCASFVAENAKAVSTAPHPSLIFSSLVVTVSAVQQTLHITADDLSVFLYDNAFALDRLPA